MLLREEGTHPSVVVGLCAVTAVVLVRGDDLNSWRFGGIVADGVGGVIVYKLARHKLVVDRIVNGLLLIGRESAPKVLAFGLIEMRHSTTCSHQRPKIIKIHKFKFFFLFLGLRRRNFFFINSFFASFFLIRFLFESSTICSAICFLFALCPLHSLYLF